MESNCYFCGSKLLFVYESDLESVTGEQGHIVGLKCQSCGTDVTFVLKEENDG